MVVIHLELVKGDGVYHTHRIKDCTRMESPSITQKRGVEDTLDLLVISTWVVPNGGSVWAAPAGEDVDLMSS